jgi:thiamine biosynthesis lipoprotein
MTSGTDRTVTRTAQIMGLPFSLRLRGPIDERRLEPAVEHVWKRLRHYDRVFSPFRPDSDLQAYRAGVPADELDPEFATIIELADLARRLTGGTFDIAGGGSVNPSGVVKGWAAQRATDHLLDEDVDFYLNAGGDLRLFCRPDGGPPWRVGIEHPGATDTLIAVVTLGTGAVATSGSAHRGNHLWDPATGAPVTTGWQATVVGPGLAWADILATAAAITGPDDLDRSGWPPGYQVMHARPDGTVRATPGLLDGDDRPGVGGARVVAAQR